ncbi:eotaxin-like [Callorhinchus milii]|uniref:eotaxin-like n=1 Tax=Callorhinchus milii TaxID=7868 RepID=UPI00045752B3|nr:eotaxin-like [Callorhinchus milii]|eukprot:gi/632989715/ref/XP_007883797.1/ PREDICTED: C-C motif chemokine 20-like [Callorhinchus milii]
MQWLHMALALVLSLTLCPQQLSAVPLAIATSSGLCCQQHIRKPLPLSRLRGYRLLSATYICTHDSIIFETKKKKLLCGDPRQQWVQDRIQQLDSMRL